MTRREYLEAILDLTANEAWTKFQEGLKSEISGTVAQELQAETIEKIKELRGFRIALQYVHDIRDKAIMEKTNADV